MMRLAFLCLALLLSCSLGAQEQELLRKEDIIRVMNKIFKQHVETKKMTPELLQNALKVYIDQFDPNHIYLLESEVRPYLNIPSYKASILFREYQNNDWTTFVNLNRVIQESILRSRRIRKEIENSGSINKVPQISQDFPITHKELKQRIMNNLDQFISDKPLKAAKGIAQYEQEMRDHEDPYLATNSEGNIRSVAEQEGLFVLHVLKALASGLDVHTGVLNPREADVMRMKLEKRFEGVGLRLTKRGDDIVITGIVEGSPAAKSELISVNDRLVEVDSHKVAGESLDQVVEWLRGDENTSVGLLIKREDKPDLIRVRLSRADIPINEGRVETSFERYQDGIIGKIVIHAFYQGNKGVSTENDTRAAIRKLQKEGKLLGLILDLRDNSGGFLMQAVKVVGLFISEGVVVISKYSNGEEHFYRDTDNTQIYQGPFVVLTSKETASAAEIVAQALQDYGVALIVGDERTFGKGTVQNQTITNNGAESFFKVTVGKYYTVSGRTPQLQGVKADIVVPSFYVREAIGEEYLGETIAADTIPASYSDPLSDIPPSLKLWYQRYYTQNLQQKELKWQKMVPILSKKSTQRLNRRGNYISLIEDEKEFTAEDPQMEEAVNIVKDMIQIDERSVK